MVTNMDEDIDLETLEKEVRLLERQKKELEQAVKEKSSAPIIEFENKIIDRGISTLKKIASGMTVVGIYAMIIAGGALAIDTALEYFLPQTADPSYHWWDVIMSFPFFTQIFLWMLLAGVSFVVIAFLMWSANKIYRKLLGK